MIMREVAHHDDDHDHDGDDDDRGEMAHITNSLSSTSPHEEQEDGVDDGDCQ